MFLVELTHDIYSMRDHVTSLRERGSVHVPRKYMISIFRENIFKVR